jgi:hypothetical protein
MPPMIQSDTITRTTFEGGHRAAFVLFREGDQWPISFDASATP